MIKKLLVFLLAAVLLSCNMEQIGQKLYEGKRFVVYSEKVVQDTFKAEAKSAEHIVSTYQSPANRTYSKALTFKFSINGKDNELPYGVNHTVVVDPGQNNAMTSRLISFGKQDSIKPERPEEKYLEPNAKLTLRADMRHVFNAFEEQGYYTFYDGSRIYKEDFKGLWVAGGSKPLTWDFDNLPSRNELQMQDPDGDHIYEITLLLNKHNPDAKGKRSWQLSADISKYPEFQSGFRLSNALYNMSLEELKMLINEDNTFDTGAEWPGVWTRDISYSVLLSLAILEPEIAKNSLMKKVKNGRIIQDTGTGGSYPVSTDRMVWAIAAWEIYKTTGDAAWLEQAYAIIKKSMEEDLVNAWNDRIKMFRGESSFLDWREQTYPDWMEPANIYDSYNLGTNAVFFKGLRVLVEMGHLLDKNTGKYEELATDLKVSMNKLLWIENRGYYGQYLYGKNFPVLSGRAESLGENLCVLFDAVKNQEQANEVVQSTPVLEYGIPCIYPQIPDIPPYHNNAIWPFVQAFRAWAAAKVKNQTAVEKGIASIYRPAALFLTNKENMIATTGDYEGTQVNSDRQLWSVAGNLAIVYRIFFGMEYRPDELVFQPFLPKVYGGVKELNNFKYRDATLNIRIEGYGDKIESFILDDKALEDPIIPGDISGKHHITIFMSNSFTKKGQIRLAKNHFTARTPEIMRLSRKLVWKSVEKAQYYRVYRNGKLLHATPASNTEISDTVNYSEYQVSAIDSAGWESFLSPPRKVVAPKNLQYVEIEDRMPASDLKYKGYSGDGFVEMDTATTIRFTLEIKPEETGNYLLDFRYSNGYGPVNTDNKCAIRSLRINGKEMGTVVFPQRGTDEWSNWGYTNSHSIYLKEGPNQIKLVYAPENANMSDDVNGALVDMARLIKAIPKFSVQ